MFLTYVAPYLIFSATNQQAEKFPDSGEPAEVKGMLSFGQQPQVSCVRRISSRSRQTGADAGR